MRAVLLAGIAILLSGCATEGVVQKEASEGEWLEFYCVPFSPCARIGAHAEGGATGYRLELDASLRGGYSAQAEVDGATVHLSGFGFGEGGSERFEGRLGAGRAEVWRFTFAPLSGEIGGAIRMRIEWIRDEAPALCDPPGPPGLYTGAELLERVEVLKDSPRDVARCILDRVAPSLHTWNGTRYANLSGDVNRAQRGVDAETWAVALRGDFGGPSDVWHFTVHVADGRAKIDGGLMAAGALPPDALARARAIFEESPEWPDVRERAPHFAPNLTRWEPEKRIVLFYDALPEGSAGIPERPFARVTLDVAEGRVVLVDRSEWW